MRKLVVVLAVSFLFFILWVIYWADLGRPTFFHRLINEIPYGDKAGHFFLFGVLAFLSNLALKLRRIRFSSFSVYLGSGLVFAFAVVEELSQAFFPQRTLDFADLLAGALGIFVFSIFSKSSRWN